MAEDYWNCPNCGAELKIKAKVCRECGADDFAGWNTEEDYSHAFPEMDDFDYDEFVSNEFGGAEVKPKGMKWWVWILALLLIATFLLFLMR